MPLDSRTGGEVKVTCGFCGEEVRKPDRLASFLHYVVTLEIVHTVCHEKRCEACPDPEIYEKERSLDKL